jgi:rhamnosyltransferase
LYIIDNSSYFNESIKLFCDLNSNTFYFPQYQNLGVSKGLNIGIEMGLVRGFDFILTMDQDSKAPINLVSGLLEGVLSFKDVGIISPLHSNKFNTHLVNIDPNKIDKVTTTMTSGNLLCLNACKESGNFLEKLFIDYVDIEYCLRLKQKNFSIYRVNNIVLEHIEGNLSQKKIFSKTFYPINNHPIRIYYKTRNLLYIIKKYRKIEPSQIREEINVYLRNILKMLIFENQKFAKIKMVFLGTLDYFRNNMGRKQD